MIIKSVPEDFVVKEVMQITFDENGNHSIYLLSKRDWNTEDAIQWLSRALKIPRKRFGVCGNKDRIAVTEQYLTIERGPNNVRTPDGFTLTYLGRVKEPLRLGTHQRNHFTIVVRGLAANEVPKHTPKVKNYFGEQRFSKQNDEIGFMLLRKEYAKAASALGLNFTTDPISALRTVPKHSLIFYVHAAQSRLWNEYIKEIDENKKVSDSFDTGINEVLLPGYGSMVDEKMLALLEKRGLDESCFVNRSFPELSVEGTLRAVWQDVEDFSATDIIDGCCTLSFSLPPGQYATETVKQVFS